jgi:hypothetical protein
MVDTIFKNLNILFQLADVHRLFDGAIAHCLASL